MFRIFSIVLSVILWSTLGSIIWALAPILKISIAGADRIHRFFQ
jgi:hypothetical protein